MRRGKDKNDDLKRELAFKEDGQEYAQETKMLENGRLEANLKEFCVSIGLYNRAESPNIGRGGRPLQTSKQRQTKRRVMNLQRPAV